MNLHLSSIIIFVENVEALKQFYVNILGLEILEETHKEWLLLKAGNCNIGLHKIGDQYLDTALSASEKNTKIVFDIDEDIQVVCKELTSKNVNLGEIKTWDNYGYWLCDGEDPEGNVFQLRQKK